MNLNRSAILVATLIPNVMGMIWYNPRVFGSMWQKESGVVPANAERKRRPIDLMLTSS